MDDLPAGDRGTGFGLVRTLYILGGAFATTVVGVTADLAGWLVAFGGLALPLAAALGLIGANRLLGLGL